MSAKQAVATKPGGGRGAKAALGLGLFAAAVVGALILGRIQVAEWTIAYLLRANGIMDARFRVEALGPTAIRIEPFEVGREVKIRRIAATWSWPDVLGRKIDAVEIDGFALDASNPDGGVIKTLRGRSGGPGGGAIALPRVVVRGGSVTGARPPLSFAVAFDATMTPDGSATVRFRDARVHSTLGDHAPGLENGQGTIAVAAGAKSATLTLDEGRIADTAKVPWFKPLVTGATANYADGRATFTAEATTAAGAAIVVSGEHDVGKGEGGAKLLIPGFRFDDAVRPSDIAPVLGDALSARGGIFADIRARWSGTDLAAEGVVDLDDVSLDAGTAKIEGLTAQAKISSQGRTAAVTIEPLRVRIQAGDSGIALSGAAIMATYDLAANRTAFKVRDAKIVDIGTREQFRPSVVTAEGNVQGTAVTAKTTVRLAAHPTVGVAADGTFDTAKNTGRARIATEGLAFKAGGLAPADLSPLLAPIGKASGAVVADADLTWRAGRIGGNARIDLDGVSFEAQGARIRGMTAAVRIDNIDPPAGSAQIVRAGIGYGAHAVRIEAANARLAPEDGGSVLTLEDALVADAAKAPRLAPIHLSGRATKRAAAARFDAKAVAPGGVTVTAQGEHALGTDAGRATLDLSPVTFVPQGVQPKDIAPALAAITDVSGTLAGKVGVVWTKNRLSGTGAITARRVGLKAGGIALDGMDADIALESIAPTKVRLSIPETWLTMEGERARIGDVAAEAIHDPVAMTPPLLVRLKDATVADGRSPARVQALRLAGSATFDNRVVHFEGRADGTAGGRLAARGEHRLGGSGKADLRLEKIVFGPALQPGALAPALKIVEPASGAVSGIGAVVWGSGGMDGNVAVTFDDLSVTHETTTIEGIAGTLRLDSLRPLSGPAQTLSAKRIGAAALLTNPSVKFSIEPAGSLARLRVEKAEAGLFGGRAFAENFIVDPQAATHRISLRLDGVDLESLFQYLEIEGLSGTGRIAGTVPVVIAGDAAAIDKARLAAIDGGVLRFRNMPARGVMAAGGDHLELVGRVLDDLRYDRLSLAVDKAAGGDARIDLFVRGFNPLVMEGHPFAINLSLNGNVDKFLAQVLAAHGLSNKAIRATVDGVR